MGQRLGVGPLSCIEKGADLVDRTSNHLEIGCCGRMVLRCLSERSQPACPEIGARPFQGMRTRPPCRPSLQGSAHLLEIRLSAGQEQGREFAFQFEVAIGEAQQVIDVDDWFDPPTGCLGRCELPDELLEPGAGDRTAEVAGNAEPVIGAIRKPR